jgi:predicted Zn-dependent protease
MHKQRELKQSLQAFEIIFHLTPRPPYFNEGVVLLFGRISIIALRSSCFRMERFADLTEEELAESLKSGKNKNTIASTKTGYSFYLISGQSTWRLYLCSSR